MLAALSAKCGVPVVTSGVSVVAALRALGARRVALVSPYPRALTETSVGYWESFGLEVAKVIEVGAIGGGVHHPIYAMPAADARAGLDALDGVAGLDAVVMLGTGDADVGADFGQAAGRRCAGFVVHASDGLEFGFDLGWRGSVGGRVIGLDRAAVLAASF